jgi:hypothetical protein
MPRTRRGDGCLGGGKDKAQGSRPERRLQTLRLWRRFTCKIQSLDFCRSRTTTTSERPRLLPPFGRARVGIDGVAMGLCISCAGLTYDECRQPSVRRPRRQQTALLSPARGHAAWRRRVVKVNLLHLEMERSASDLGHGIWHSSGRGPRLGGMRLAEALPLSGTPSHPGLP